MATITTIARRAGVSPGTVDRVIHGRGRVKPETAARVRAVMEELDFQPNSLGRAFYMARQNNKIGVLVAQREADFQSQVLEGVAVGVDYARQHGIQVLTETADPDDEAGYLAALERLLAEDIRGLALRGLPSRALASRLARLRADRLPVLVYNEDVDSSLRDCFVGQDDRQSGACAAYLMAQMCRGKGSVLIVGVTEQNRSSRERIAGFADSYRRLAPGADVRCVIYGGGNHELARGRVAEAIRTIPDLEGIFVSGAGLSGAAHAVEDARLAGRVKIVGYDVTGTNVAYLKRGTVQFLIDQDPREQGSSAVRLLADAIFRDGAVDPAGKDTGIRVVVPCNC